MAERLIGYVRVSRVAGRDDLVSPEIQRKKIEDWATLHDAEIVRWYDEIDQPGSKLDRPMFQEALGLCEEGKADGIVVYRLDRFARSVVHGLQCIKRLEDASCRFVSVNEGFDAGTDVGRLVITILFAFAELELKKIKQNWAHAITNAIEAGRYISAKVPTGYIKNAEGRLDVDPATADHVRKLFELRAQGTSWAGLGDYLTDHGVPTAWGNPRWSPSATRRLVINRAYLGEARQGDTVNPRAHDPIVTEKEWNAAQPSQGITLAKNGSRSSLCVVRGVLVCAGCGHKMQVGGRSAQNGKVRPPHYFCRKRHPSGLCPAPASAGHAAIDEYVEQVLIAAFGNEGPLAEGLVRQEQAEEARRELEAATFALSQYVTNTTLIDTIGLETFNEGAQAHQQRVELARMQVEEAEAQLATVEGVADGDLLSAWKAGELTPLERRAIVAKMVDRVILFRSTTPGKKSNRPISERVQIVLKGNTLLAATDGEPVRSTAVLPPNS